MEASPDGNWLAVGTSFGDIYLADTRTGTLSLLSSIGEGTIDGFSWSPDSAWLGWSEPVTSFGSRSRLRLAGIDAGRNGTADRDRQPDRSSTSPTAASGTNRRVHPGRQIPRLPVQPQLRPGLRRPLLRPVLPEPDQALPRGPRRRHAVAVRPERRPAGRRRRRRTAPARRTAGDAGGPGRSRCPGRRRGPGPPRHQRPGPAGQLLRPRRHRRRAALARPRTRRRDR